ncbi:MAG: pirin family protein [Betaproteobacteria bacterium]
MPQATPDPIVTVAPLGFPWATVDPFLFCVYHDDAYPKGNAEMGPAASLAGRDIGQDFAGKDGWRMYHGSTVPGFPSHPHRGFETVTIVRRGLIDHSDSLGATARFGGGDVQWLTAGRGIVHAEMFPLVDETGANPLELFQVWLNLPKANKMVEPHFTMLWSEELPRRSFVDNEGATTEVVGVAGTVGGFSPLPPPPKSWAASAQSDLAILTVRMTPRARWTLPAAASAGTRRNLYFFKGSDITLAGRRVPVGSSIELRADAEVELSNGGEVAELLMLQGRPIGEPVAQYGPFVMNTEQEIRQAFDDYRRTQFGGWPWKRSDPVHPREQGRFARHVDGRIENR